MLLSSLFLVACSSKTEDTGTEPEQTAQPEPANTPDEETDNEDTADAGASEDQWYRAKDKSLIPAESLARTDTIIIGMQEPAGIFNPYYRNTSYDQYVIDTIFDPLLDSNPDGSLKEGLAHKWEISDDGLTYTFYLRDDVKFTDGVPVTAHDAEFVFYLLADPTYDGVADMSKPKIKGFDDYKKGDAQTIEGIKVLDDHTLQIETTEALAPTLRNINVTVLPKHYYGEGFSKGNLETLITLHQKPLGSGQYIFESYTAGQEVRLTANENYYKGAPKVKNLIFKPTTPETDIAMLQVGETDFEEGISVNADNIELLESLGFLDYSKLLNNGYGYIGMNHNLPKFQDVRVRQALVYGLNREDIVYAYSQGHANVINVPQSKLSWAYPEDESVLNPYPYDPEKAKQLLDEAGWEVGADGYRYKDGEKLVIHFAASSPNEVNDAIIPYATENYKELGIEFIPEQLEFNAVVEKVDSGNVEMWFMAWGLTAEPDPKNIFHSEGSQNKPGSSYSNPKVDELIDAGLKELDQDKRKEIYNELYQVMNEDLPYIFMYQRYNMNTVNSRIQGFEISPYVDFSENLHNVVIEAK